MYHKRYIEYVIIMSQYSTRTTSLLGKCYSCPIFAAFFYAIIAGEEENSYG